MSESISPWHMGQVSMQAHLALAPSPLRRDRVGGFAKACARLHERPAEYIGASPFGWFSHLRPCHVESDTPVAVISGRLGNQLIASCKEHAAQLRVASKL